jgi:type VII secretion-associated serine protease mycosin
MRWRRAGGAGLIGLIAVASAVVPAVPAAAAPIACQQAPTPGTSIPPLAPRDPLITALGLDQAWSLSTGANVTVGVVDTGVDPASPKLAGAVQDGSTYHVVQTKAVFARAVDGRQDCDGHGTEVAGVIAGRTDAGDDRVSGVAPSASIYPVAIQGDIAQAPAALIAAAIKDAAAHATVINLSFAQTVDSPDIKAAIEYALGRDVVVVASAANETGTGASGGAATWYPAAYPGVLAVSSVSADGSPDSNAATGKWIGLAAPGDSITTVTRGGQGYVTVTGTSFATAIVSGAAALLRSRFPHLSGPDVVARLEHTAVPPGDGSHDNQLGYGIVDPFAALTLSAPAPGSAATGSTRGGSVPIQAIHPRGTHGSSGRVLGVTAVLIALAVLVGLATISVRTGRRRGWYAGQRPRTVVDDRTVEAHPAELF